MEETAAVKPKVPPMVRGRRSYMMAVVLGTAAPVRSAAQSLEASQAQCVSEQTVTDLSRYCTACWRNARLHPDCWNDCTQAVFERLLERVAPQTWPSILHTEGDDRRELVRAIDAVKKRTQARLAANEHAGRRSGGLPSRVTRRGSRVGSTRRRRNCSATGSNASCNSVSRAGR